MRAPNPKIAERNAQIIARYRDGAAYKDIAVEFHLARGSVSAIITKAGAAQGRTASPQLDPKIATRNAQIIARYRDGATYREIANEFHLTVGLTGTIIWRAGVAEGRKRIADPAVAARNAQIIARYRDGAMYREIAKEFHITLGLVSLIISRAGVAEGRKRIGDLAVAARNAEIIARYRDGALYKDIAEAFHLSFGSVSRIISSAGAVQGRRRGPRPSSAARSVSHPGHRSAPQTKRATTTPGAPRTQRRRSA